MATLPRTPAEFRSWLRGLRTNAGLTQEAAAAAVEVERRNVLRWENEGTEPGALLFLRLLEAYGIRIEPQPAGVPRAINAELADLVAAVTDAHSFARSRFERLERRLGRMERELGAALEAQRVAAVKGERG